MINEPQISFIIYTKDEWDHPQDQQSAAQDKAIKKLNFAVK